MSSEINKKAAAYALNMWTVSVSQIIEYNDVNIMEQEYDTIMNNLNLEKMPKDEALLDVIKEIMDEITNLKMDNGDRKIVDMEYQNHIKNAIWTAVPSIGAIFATSNPVAMGLTLATQVGIGYMNYRRNRAEYQIGYEKSKWEIQRNRMQHLNGLQKQLFETAWRMADTHEFQDTYRLTARQIKEYTQALMEENPFKRYKALEAMQDNFEAYPPFWYQIGSTANSIYRSKQDEDILSLYKIKALKCFEKYDELSKTENFELLRNDIITSSWALEYLELLDYNKDYQPDTAFKLIRKAEKHSGNALDVLELCAFAYLKIADYKNAIRLFEILVNKDYNVSINLQLLSGLYIREMRESDQERIIEARVGYKQLPSIVGEENIKFILPVPDKNVKFEEWKPDWNREESFAEILAKQEAENREKRINNTKQRADARAFYQMPIIIVYHPTYEEIADYFLSVLNENRCKVDKSLPAPTRMLLKEYKLKRTEIEGSGKHIIFLGDSDEAKKFYKKAKNYVWDYYQYGMRYMSYGNKTVILTRKIKNRDLNGLIVLAKKVSEKHKIIIPDVGSIDFSFMKELLEGRFDDPGEAVATIITMIICTPLLALGQALEALQNGIILINNAASAKKIEFLQYCINIYTYLDQKKALVDD